MQFRNVVLFAAALCAALVAARPGHARDLILSHQLPEADARHRAAKVLAAEVRKRVPDLMVRIHPNGSLVRDPPKQYEAMQERKIDMTIYPMGYASSKFPELSIVTLPGVPASAELAALLKNTEFEEQLQLICEEKGFRILSWWWLDGGMASRGRPVTGPQTIKDLGARSGGGNDFNSMLEAAGARIVAMPLSEVRSAIETGKLDVAQSSFETFVSYRFYETAKYVTVGGFSTLTVFTPVLISKATWDSLNGTERQALEDAAIASEIYLEASQREAQEHAIEVFTKAGVKVQALTYEDYAAWLTIARDTAWKNYRAVSPRASDLLDSLLRAFVESSKR
ncbi:MAG TPA: TRAP transporter substrate-binding protein DctP [Hyphomicrobiaceae bacterium]|jgi:TRAP-type C4-dicarboxylate transport system substrate-binding protein|nr:TRAP transporter substrate-binding protein DctP [Hyphomicrobiaceae bacterium]HEX2338524.1 TRAP transporter substrate-binding protein DctP [Hyphomicrobiaceae bacterium]